MPRIRKISKKLKATESLVQKWRTFVNKIDLFELIFAQNVTFDENSTKNRPPIRDPNRP